MILNENLPDQFKCAELTKTGARTPNHRYKTAEVRQRTKLHPHRNAFAFCFLTSVNIYSCPFVPEFQCPKAYTACMERYPFLQVWRRLEVIPVAINWTEDDQDTLVLFLEIILDSYRQGKISRVHAISMISDAFSQAGLKSGSSTAYMKSVIQEQQSLH
jgi:hypothetical protein